MTNTFGTTKPTASSASPVNTEMRAEIADGFANQRVRTMKHLCTWILIVTASVLLVLGTSACRKSTAEPPTVVVPRVVGKPIAEATTALADQKLLTKVAETKTTGTVQPGEVSSQSPAEGETVAEGSTIELIVEDQSQGKGDTSASPPPPIRIGPPATSTPGNRPPPIRIGPPAATPTPGGRPSPIRIGPPPATPTPGNRPPPIRIKPAATP